MGKRGPQPKPTALKLVEGVRPSRVNQDEPQMPPLAGTPEPPEWLSEVAAAYWRDLAPQMVPTGVLTAADLHGFAVLCEAFDLHQRAAMILNGDGEEIVNQGERGKVRHVALTVLRDSAATIRSWSQEFGLTPSARSRISVPTPDRADQARQILS